MFYEVAIKVTRLQENGKEKEFIERYITDCDLFAEAEANGMKEYSDYQLRGDVVAIKRSNIYEIVNQSNQDNEKLFKAKIVSIFVDENGREKEQPYHVLVWATDMNDANQKMNEYMKQGMQDLLFKEVKETKILNII